MLRVIFLFFLFFFCGYVLVSILFLNGKEGRNVLGMIM